MTLRQLYPRVAPRSMRRRRCVVVAESIEARLLFAAAPTNFEQYQLELLNRARANPAAEVTRQAGQTWGDDPAQVPGTAFPQPQTPNLNEGLPAGTISTAAKQPLAFNTSLIQAARDYSQTLLDNNTFGHTFGGTTPQGRMQSAGYTFSPLPAGSGENLAATGSTGPYPINAAVAAEHHANLFVDGNTTGRGHRTNMMSPNWREVGIGMAQKDGYTGFGGSFNTVISTQDFAFVAGNPFLTGVAYTDAVAHDSFYTPGEGLGGVTVTAAPVGGGAALSTTTFSSGGYSLQVPAGTYNVTASGGALASPVTSNNVVVGSLNVKVDFIPGADTTPPTATASGAGLGYVYTQNPHLIKFKFSEGVVGGTDASLQVRSVPGNVPVAATLQGYDAATQIATWALPASLPPDGNYRATLLAAGIKDAANNQLAADVPLDFFILRGDANHDRTVGPGDFNLLATHFGQGGQNFSTGDFNGDGTVGPEDFNLLASRFGTTLSPPAGLTAAATGSVRASDSASSVLSRQPARKRVTVVRHGSISSAAPSTVIR